MTRVDLDQLERAARALAAFPATSPIAVDMLAAIAELRAARVVVEAVRGAADHGAGETYCDVGAPDDCDHCVIAGAIADYDAAAGGPPP